MLRERRTLTWLSQISKESIMFYAGLTDWYVITFQAVFEIESLIEHGADK